MKSSPSLPKSRADYSRELKAFGSVYDRGVRLSYDESQSREEGGTGEIWVITRDADASVCQFFNRARALSAFVEKVKEAAYYVPTDPRLSHDD